MDACVTYANSFEWLSEVIRMTSTPTLAACNLGDHGGKCAKKQGCLCRLVIIQRVRRRFLHISSAKCFTVKTVLGVLICWEEYYKSWELIFVMIAFGLIDNELIAHGVMLSSSECLRCRKIQPRWMYTHLDGCFQMFFKLDMEWKINLVSFCDQVFPKERNKSKRATCWREQGLM